ncbi:MAG TPA: hypothetical protein VMB03_30020 [Bryobacteraceae bacterium]|nr:hypothetical protein [Bryobacteraceae bacterium]
MIAPVAFVGIGFLVMLLWNWLVPSVLGGRTINFWQAWGIFFLSKLLFGGFQGGSGHRSQRRLRERWEHMTPEERARFGRGVAGQPEAGAPGPA